MINDKRPAVIVYNFAVPEPFVEVPYALFRVGNKIALAVPRAFLLAVYLYRFRQGVLCGLVQRLAAVMPVLERFQNDYNYNRPHRSLKGSDGLLLTPAEYLKKSLICYES